MRRPRARCPGASLWRVARLRWPRLGARGLCLVAICLAAACACARAAPAAWQRHAGGQGGASAPPPPPAPAPAPAPGGSFASGAEAQAEASEAEGDLEAALRASSADEVGLAGQRMHWGGGMGPVGRAGRDVEEVGGLAVDHCPSRGLKS